MKIPKTIKISKCRLCLNKKLKKVYSFGNLFVSNFVSKKGIKRGIKAPLTLVYCEKCKLLQLENSFNPDTMYGDNYGYMSSLNLSMVTHLKKKAENLKLEFNVISDNILVVPEYKINLLNKNKKTIKFRKIRGFFL